jgi:hypothetical protein
VRESHSGERQDETDPTFVVALARVERVRQGRAFRALYLAGAAIQVSLDVDGAQERNAIVSLPALEVREHRIERIEADDPLARRDEAHIRRARALEQGPALGSVTFVPGSDVSVDAHPHLLFAHRAGV